MEDYNDLILEGDLDLIEFAYDVGIGEKNSMGFEWLNYWNNLIKKESREDFS